MLQRRGKMLACLLLALVTVVIYAPLATHEFIHLDDTVYVTDNYQVQAGLTLAGVAWAFTTTQAGNWHPLTWLSHMLDCQLFGLHPGAHHLVNLLFHLANTLLLFLWFHRTTQALGPSFLVAALFAWHPLHVESVAWVAERKDVLSTFFWLLTMWGYVWYVESPGARRYLLALLCFGLGLMAKPMLVTLPFVLVLLDYWPLGRVGQGVSLARLIKEKAPFFALSALFSLIALYAQKAAGAVAPLPEISLTSRVVVALLAYVSYLWKMLWPARLAVLYPHPGNAIPWWAGLVAALILAALSLLIIRRARRCPYLLVGWLWYLGTLVPVIGLVQVGPQALADRYSYVPLIGVFLMVAWGMADLAAKWRGGKLLMPLAGGVMLAALALLAGLQVRYWQDSLTLFQHTLRLTWNNPIIHYNLGVALDSRGQEDQAMTHYQEALRLNPKSSGAHVSLGIIYFSRGQVDQALVHFQEALGVNPGNPEAHLNLGVALMLQGNEEALAHFQEALRLNPDYPALLDRLARIQATFWNEKFRDGPRAVEMAEKANRLTGYRQPEYLDTLAAAYAEAGRFPEALEVSRKALNLATSLGLKELALDIESRTYLYQAGLAYHARP